LIDFIYIFTIHETHAFPSNFVFRLRGWKNFELSVQTMQESHVRKLFDITLSNSVSQYWKCSSGQCFGCIPGFQAETRQGQTDMDNRDVEIWDEWKSAISKISQWEVSSLLGRKTTRTRISDANNKPAKMRRRFTLDAAKSRDVQVADTLAKLQSSVKKQIRGTLLRQKQEAWLKEYKRLKAEETQIGWDLCEGGSIPEQSRSSSENHEADASADIPDDALDGALSILWQDIANLRCSVSRKTKNTVASETAGPEDQGHDQALDNAGLVKLFEVCRYLQNANQLAVERCEAFIEDLSADSRTGRKLASKLLNERHLMDLSEDEEAFLEGTDETKETVTVIDSYLVDISQLNDDYMQNVAKKREEMQAVSQEIEKIDSGVYEVCARHFYNTFCISSIADGGPRLTISEAGNMCRDPGSHGPAHAKARVETFTKSRMSIDVMVAELMHNAARGTAFEVNSGSQIETRQRTKSDHLPSITVGDSRLAGEQDAAITSSQKNHTPTKSSDPCSVSDGREIHKSVLQCLRLLERRRYVQMQEGITFKTWRERRRERLRCAEKERDQKSQAYIEGIDSALQSAKREVRNLRTRGNLISLRVRRDQDLLQSKLGKSNVKEELQRIETEITSKHERTRELHEKVDQYHQLKQHEKDVETEKMRALKDKRKMEYMEAAKKNAERVRVRDEICRIKDEEKARRKAMREEHEEMERRRMMYILEKLKPEAHRNPERLTRLPHQRHRYFDPKRAIVRDGCHDVFGYFEERLRQDPRYRLSAALHNANMMRTDAGRSAMMRTVPTLPQGHALRSEIPGLSGR